MTWQERRVAAMPKDSQGRPVSFRNIAASDLPARFRLIDEMTHEVVWDVTVHGAGALEVPGFRPRRVAALIDYLGSGDRVLAFSDGTVLLGRAADDAAGLLVGSDGSGDDA